MPPPTLLPLPPALRLWRAGVLALLLVSRAAVVVDSTENLLCSIQIVRCRPGYQECPAAGLPICNLCEAGFTPDNETQTRCESNEALNLETQCSLKLQKMCEVHGNCNCNCIEECAEGFLCTGVGFTSVCNKCDPGFNLTASRRHCITDPPVKYWRLIMDDPFFKCNSAIWEVVEVEMYENRSHALPQFGGGVARSIVQRDIDLGGTPRAITNDDPYDTVSNIIDGERGGAYQSGPNSERGTSYVGLALQNLDVSVTFVKIKHYETVGNFESCYPSRVRLQYTHSELSIWQDFGAPQKILNDGWSELDFSKGEDVVETQTSVSKKKENHFLVAVVAAAAVFVVAIGYVFYKTTREDNVEKLRGQLNQMYVRNPIKFDPHYVPVDARKK